MIVTQRLSTEVFAYLSVFVHQKIVGTQSKDCQSSDDFPTCFRSVSVLCILETKSWKRLRSIRSRATGGPLIHVCWLRSRNFSNTLTVRSCQGKISCKMCWISIVKKFWSKCPATHEFPRHVGTLKYTGSEASVICKSITFKMIFFRSCGDFRARD